jgi:hypothetical protein
MSKPSRKRRPNAGKVRLPSPIESLGLDAGMLRGLYEDEDEDFCIDPDCLDACHEEHDDEDDCRHWH